METWFIIILTLTISVFIKSLISLFSRSNRHRHSLPPGPVKFPVIGSILWLRKPLAELESIIRSLQKHLGPIITLHIGSRPAIFVADRSLAHQALVHNGAVFADRPPAFATGKIISCNQHNISSSFYGPTWRLFRRNLTSEILHPSRIKSYSHARKWVLAILLNRFESHSKSGDPVTVLGNFRYAMFCLLVLMCFGDKLDQKKIEEIKRVEHTMIVNIRKFDKLNIMPRLSKILFRKLWSELMELQKQREDVLIPLIRARKKVNEERKSKSSDGKKDDGFVLSYVDTLFDLQLPAEQRRLTEKELASLCSEFLNGGTDTTATALQWIIANLIKYPCIQHKLFMEIKGVVAEGDEVKEDDLQKLPYLKAVVLEGLRRHPPGHLLLPHAVTEDVVLDKYLIPKNASINVMIADIGWDPKVWEDPMSFRPERFMDSGNNGEVFDITGSREIKMMPFGVGRRICPGYGLALLHLEYFVANLVWNFEWKAIDGDSNDLSEKTEFTIVMKNPLQAHISSRFNRAFAKDPN